MRGLGLIGCFLIIGLSFHFVSQGSSDQQARDLATQKTSTFNSHSDYGLPLTQHRLQTLQDLTNINEDQ